MTMVNLQLNDYTHHQAMSVLSNMGITLDDAVNLMLFRIAEGKRLPFANLNDTDNIENSNAQTANYRLGALESVPNINVPDNFDDIEISEFDV